MKNKNGFTLVELLAVIVVLGIIMAVAGTQVFRIKKNADIEAAKKLEQSLADLGLNIYSYESTSGVKDNESYCKKEYDKAFYEDFNCWNNVGKTDKKTISGNEYMQYFNYNYQGLSAVNENLLDKPTVEERKTYQATSILIRLDELEAAEYLNTDDLKIGNKTCKGFLRIYKTTYGPYFEGNICCPGIYSTNKGAESTEDCGIYDKSNASGLTFDSYKTNLSGKYGWVTTLTK